jgi:putative ABC transport system permease protein
VPIIGVVRDINFESLHRGVEPMVLALGTGTPGRISLRLRPGGAGEAIKHVEEIWKKSFPQAPFKYSFLDESFERMYQAEIRLGRLFSFYTALAIVISCVGLLALISYSNEKRTREVGIRKVLGASEGRLFMLLSREYLILVILANLAAWPVSAWAMSSWMNNFAYKAPFAWWFYPVAGGLALLLAVATSASLTLRVCAVNPAETLRHQ